MNRPTVCKLPGCNAATPHLLADRPAEYCSDAHRRRAALERLHKLHEQEAADMTPRQLAEELCKITSKSTRTKLRDTVILIEAGERIVYHQAEHAPTAESSTHSGSKPTA